MAGLNYCQPGIVADYQGHPVQGKASSITHPVSSSRTASQVVKPRDRRPPATAAGRVWLLPGEAGGGGGGSGVADGGEGEAGRVGGRAAVDAAHGLGAAREILQTRGRVLVIVRTRTYCSRTPNFLLLQS